MLDRRPGASREVIHFSRAKKMRWPHSLSRSEPGSGTGHPGNLPIHISDSHWNLRRVPRRDSHPGLSTFKHLNGPGEVDTTEKQKRIKVDFLSLRKK